MDPHQQTRTEMTLATHRRIRQRRRGSVCVACGQSWPCGDYEWATGEAGSQRWTLAEAMRAASLLIVFGVGVPLLLSRLAPVPVWMVLLVIAPVCVIAVGWAIVRRHD